MSKAIEGAALIGAALVGEVLVAVYDPTLLFSPMFQHAMESLALGGAAMEVGAIASMLTNTSGTSATVHQAAAPRQVIYGQRRVAGTTIYESTTGSHHDQVNLIIVLAGHVCDSIPAIYLDGREVFFTGGGSGWSVRNGVGFGGDAAGGDHIGPGGQHYDFGLQVYCEARYGDQVDGDVMGSIRANDPAWAADGHGNSPWVGGCTYLYVKMQYNPNLFPNGPLQVEIKVTVNGKNDIFDPRTGARGFSNNWALCVADKITDPIFGLGDVDGVNQAQLIAAANVCDEQVALGIGGTESRYTLNWTHDTGTAPGAALDIMMSAAAGRLSYIGGEWFIWPAYWQGPSFTFDENNLTAAMQWKPNRSARDLINRVNGTYIAANYPYNTVGNLYDSNGWYNGSLPNTWPFAWQPSSYPQYAADPRHGYAADQWLLADGGIERPLELAQPCVVSITQAQRLAKIALLRNRRQGSGLFEMNLAAWSMQPLSVMQFTFPAMGWTEKTLEIVSTHFKIESGSADTPPSLRVDFGVQETAASDYEWSTAEELSVYDVPTNPARTSWDPAPPTNMSLTSSAATAVIGADGVVHPRIEVQWDTPLDVLTRQIQVEYQSSPAGVAVGPWLNAGFVSAALNLAYIPDVIAGHEYNVRIRSVRASGSISVWEEIDGYTVSITLSVLAQLALAPGSLVGEAFLGGAAAIVPGNGAGNFVAMVGNLSVAVAPANYPLAVANQGQLYWIYYIDPTFAGGAVTAIATQLPADFLNKVGYFLIDSVVTPVYSSAGGTGGRYSPASFTDTGTRGTQNPGNAIDHDVTTFATVAGSFNTPGGAGAGTGTTGRCTWNGFAATTLATPSTLYIGVEAVGTADAAIPYSLSVSVGGTVTVLLSGAASVPALSYTVALASGVDLSSISVTATVTGADSADFDSVSPLSQTASLNIFEIYIQ